MALRSPGVNLIAIATNLEKMLTGNWLIIMLLCIHMMRVLKRNQSVYVAIKLACSYKLFTSIVLALIEAFHVVVKSQLLQRIKLP